MATKTITLELDAYDKLKAAKRGEKESFSSVVRRAAFPSVPHTGGAILEHLSTLSAEDIPPPETFEYWAKAIREDRERPRISPSAWEAEDAS